MCLPKRHDATGKTFIIFGIFPCQGYVLLINEKSTCVDNDKTQMLRSSPLKDVSFVPNGRCSDIMHEAFAGVEIKIQCCVAQV